MNTSFRKHIEELVSLTDDEFKYVMEYFTSRTLEKHQFLVHENEIVRNDHWVVSGLLRARFLDDQGKQHILQFAMEDWWVTDYRAYFNKAKATISIDCLEQATVLCISLNDREKLCSESHKMANFFRVKSNFGYVALQQRILSLLNKNAQERYYELLNKYPSLFQRVPKKHIAAYLGVTRETLSRMGTP